MVSKSRGGHQGVDGGWDSQGQTGYGLKRRELLRRRYRPVFWLLAIHVLLAVLVMGDFVNLYIAVESALRTSELMALVIAVSVTTLVILLPFLAGKFSRQRHQQWHQRRCQRQRQRQRQQRRQHQAASALTAGGADEYGGAGVGVEHGNDAGAGAGINSGSSLIASNNIQSNIIIIVFMVVAWVAVLTALTLLRLSVCGIGPLSSTMPGAGVVGIDTTSATAGSGSAIAAIGASTRSQSLAQELAMVVVLTVMLVGSGAVAFASAWAKDPQRELLKSLEFQQLALQESVEQLSALQCEYQQADSYYIAMLEGDQACYGSRQRQLEAKSEVIRHQARLSIAEALGSPAATSALTHMVKERQAVGVEERLGTRTEDGRTARTEGGRTAHRPQIQELAELRWDAEFASGQ